jgi:hypothetical protein
MTERSGSVSFWLNKIPDWDSEPLSWAVIEPGKRAQAQTSLGSYIVEVRSDNKSYSLRFSSGADERICPIRFTASNRVVWEAEDHLRRLQAQQHQPVRLKEPRW